MVSTECACCPKPADDTLDLRTYKVEEHRLGIEPICNDCLCSLIEGGTIQELAALAFKKKGVLK